MQLCAVSKVSPVSTCWKESCMGSLKTCTLFIALALVSNRTSDLAHVATLSMQLSVDDSFQDNSRRGRAWPNILYVDHIIKSQKPRPGG